MQMTLVMIISLICLQSKKWVFSAMLDNTFKVNKNLAFELIRNVQTPVIQGTFDIESIFNLTAGLKWSFVNDRMSLSARCNDIFNTAANPASCPAVPACRHEGAPGRSAGTHLG